MSLRNNSTLNASDRLTSPLARDARRGELSGADRGGLIECSGSEADAQVRTGAAVDVAEAHLQQNLFLHRRYLDPQQVDGLAQRSGHRHHPVGRSDILYGAAHERGIVFERDVDILVGEIARQLLTHGVQPDGAQTHREVVQQAIAAFLPDDQRSLSGGLPVDQNFLGVDRHGLHQIAVGYGDPLDLHRAVDDQALTDRDHEFARSGAGSRFLGLGVLIAAGAARGGIPKPDGRQQDTCNTNSRHLFDLRSSAEFLFPLVGPRNDLHDEGDLLGRGGRHNANRRRCR